MKPKSSPQQNPQADQFRDELQNMITPLRSLVQLSEVVNRGQLTQIFAQSFNSEKSRPAISTRLMIALHYFKYTFDLSEDDVLHGWLENPYGQYFSGMKYLGYKLSIHPTSVAKWRNRIGTAGVKSAGRKAECNGWSFYSLKTRRQEI
ncbi:transposase [Desulforhopalus sp. IMCC35007]|uniref:transposase n=1 Tax=Desulforhopalus sp. IMCC35007 TaxID=2569543 RepID=UPI0010AE98B3|nr:transposase [Desulforhopalus sp. IMCC35007]TKB09675.1 transposase [Desulforhopalus sp. IMCC35007]